MTIANTKSRRQFLGTATRLLASTNAAIGPGSWPLVRGLAGLGAMAASGSHAADVSGGYKALVCLFMNGGNDSHNWVVPTDPTGYAEYAAARRELAWPLSKLSPIAVSSQASGRTFGMPEELAPMRKWYEAGQAAIIANVGTLSRPTTKADYMAGISIPSKLFSHNDQASTWQSLLPEGARTGWGGRMADALMAANAYPVFTAISTTGNAVFLSGTGVSQYHVGVEGPVAVAAIKDDMTLGSRTASAILRRSVIAQGADPLQAEYAKVMRRSLETSAILQSILPGTNVPAIPAVAIPSPLGGTTTLDKDGLAQQLRMVAMMIMAGQTLGMRRQIFMVSISGFDSHANQMRDQPSLMARVANSVDYFLSTMHGKGMLGNVTLFTASDFGRTLLSNGSGSDHGWGSHHFVAGGSVSGRNIYGRFPTLALGSADDVGSGRLLPGSSVTQVAAPLGRWLGLSEVDLASVLPGIGNFDSNALRFI